MIQVLYYTHHPAWLAFREGILLVTGMDPSINDWSYRDAFDRNRGLISDENQGKIQKARVAIAGLGGVGGVYATTLARLGVGHFTIADPDSFELSNTNRQQGASSSTMGARKNETLERMIKDINPTAEVRVFESFTPENAGDFLKDVTVVLDSIDFFTIGPRRLLPRMQSARHSRTRRGTNRIRNIYDQLQSHWNEL